MKAKDVPVFKQKILEMLPVIQSDMWRKLEICSREGSYIVDIMLKENLITRRRKDSSFLLEKLNENGKIEDIKKKAEAGIKKKAEADIKKKAEAGIKKKAEAGIKKKAEVDIKKKAEVDIKKKAEVDIKKKAEVDIKKKADDFLKKEVDFISNAHNKNIQNVKIEDINVLKRKVLDILPILQADIWKRLDACDCNYLDLIDIMVRGNLVTRTKQGKYLLIEAANGDKQKRETKVDVSSIPLDQHVQKKKPKDINDLKKLILGMLPIAPYEVLEKLDVSNSVCSGAIDAMVKENIIVKTEKNGCFLLENVNEIKKKHETIYAALISSKKRFTPCCGCMLECDAAVCTLIAEWLIE